jgi:hypothetical protein
MTVRSGSSIIASVPEPQNLTGTLLSGGGFMHGLTNAEKGNLKGVIAGRIIKGFVLSYLLIHDLYLVLTPCILLS